MPRRRRVHGIRPARRRARSSQGEQKEQAERACIETGLEALRILADMDEQVRAAGAVHWRPSLWSVRHGTLEGTHAATGDVRRR